MEDYIIQVTIGNNVKRESKPIRASQTIRDVLEQEGIDYTRGMTTIDGSTLKPGDIDKTFAALGISDKCYLLNVVKADNA